MTEHQSPSFEPAPEGLEPDVEKILEIWRGSTVSKGGLLDDLAEQVMRGELTDEQAYSTAVKLGALPEPRE